MMCPSRSTEGASSRDVATIGGIRYLRAGVVTSPPSGPRSSGAGAVRTQETRKRTDTAMARRKTRAHPYDAPGPQRTGDAGLTLRAVRRKPDNAPFGAPPPRIGEGGRIGLRAKPPRPQQAGADLRGLYDNLIGARNGDTICICGLRLCPTPHMGHTGATGAERRWNSHADPIVSCKPILLRGVTHATPFHQPGDFRCN